MDKNMEQKTHTDNEKVRKSMSGARVGGGSEQSLHIDPQEEKKLLFNLDIHIAPIVMILYLIAFLDRFRFVQHNVLISSDLISDMPMFKV
jgi:hypothetical protein